MKQIVSEVSYAQVIKTKKKEMEVEVVRKNDFMDLIKNKTGVLIPDHAVDALVPLVKLDSKFDEIF